MCEDIIIPRTLADELGLNLSDSDIYAVESMTGIIPIYRLRVTVRARVLVNDRATEYVELTPVVSGDGPVAAQFYSIRKEDLVDIVDSIAGAETFLEEVYGGVVMYL